MQQFIKSTPHSTRPFLMCAAVLDQTCSTKLVFIYSQILPGRQSQLAKRWRGSVGFQTSCPKVAVWIFESNEISRPASHHTVATNKVARIQAWNCAVMERLGKLKPCVNRIMLRTEFSGAHTAEQAVLAAAELSSGVKPQVSCLSCADWSSSSQEAATLNHPETCRFSDIMSLAPDELRKKLTEHVAEEVGSLVHIQMRYCFERFHGA